MSKIKNKFLATVPANTLKGNNTGSTANPTDLTVSQINAMLGDLLAANNLSDVTSASSAFKNISPMTTAGDIIYENSTPAPARLAIGSNGQVLTVSGGLPTWQTPSGGGGSSPTNNYWSGYTSTNAEWYVTSTTYAQIPLVSGTPSLTARGTPTMSVSAASGNYPGITFTPPSTTAVYFVSVQFSSIQQSGGNFGTYKLWDGSIIVQTSPDILTSTGYPTPMSISGIYAPGTTSAVTLQLYAACTGGYIGISNNTGSSAPLGSSMEWQIFQIVS